MIEPIISIIVPIYKVERYLRQCVDSILAQTHTNLEVILVDDGSPDGCGDICDEYTAKDSRVVVIHKENGGLSDARNAGLDIAKGEYIGFVDGDDRIAPDMYSRMLNNLTENDCDIAICGMMYEGTNSVVSHNPCVEHGVVSSEEAVMESIKGVKYTESAATRLCKKYVFAKCRFPYGRCFEDTYVLVDVLSQASKIIFDTTPKYYYRRRAGSIVNSPWTMSKFIDSVASYQSVYSSILRIYPHKAEFAKAMVLNHNCGLVYNIRNTPGHNKTHEYQEVVAEIKHNLVFAMNSKDLNNRVKIKVAALCLNVNLYRLIMRLYIGTQKKHTVDAFE